MTSMTSAAYFSAGPASVLQLIERPLPDVGIGEVRVRVQVAGVNPTDIDARRRGDPGKRFAVPHVPGQDGAGVVDAVGESVTWFSPGDRVWLWDAAWQRTEGTAQQYVVLAAEHVVALPDDVSFDLGASLGIPALTAHRTLTSIAEGPLELEPGALAGGVVLVAGGAGAVGNAAIQLATWSGAEVIATVSSDEKAALARATGAAHVIDYSIADVRDEVRRVAPGGVDLVVEVDAAANLALDLDIVAPHGGISIYTPGPGDIVIPAIAAMTKNVQFSFVLTYTTSVEQKQRAVRAVGAAIADGALRVGEQSGLPLHRFPLADIVAAHEAVENHSVGKVLVDVGDHGGGSPAPE